MPVSQYIGFVANGLREVGSRARAHGLRSAWVCLKTRAINVGVRVANRLLPAGRVACPCCGWHGTAFLELDCGQFSVPAVFCPHCRAQERHRMMHLFLTRHRPRFMHGAGYVLHFAPEQQIARFIADNPKLVRIATDYAHYAVAAGGCPGFQGDIHRLPLRDNAVAGLFCLHVLEHVADDRAALAELRRVLEPGGQAVIMVPFMMNQRETIEYGRPDPEFFDHVRGYSPHDFAARLGGFQVAAWHPEDVMELDEVRRFGVPPSQVLYVCTKPVGTEAG